MPTLEEFLAQKKPYVVWRPGNLSEIVFVNFSPDHKKTYITLPPLPIRVEKDFSSELSDWENFLLPKGEDYVLRTQLFLYALIALIETIFHGSEIDKKVVLKKYQEIILEVLR